MKLLKTNLIIGFTILLSTCGSRALQEDPFETQAYPGGQGSTSSFPFVSFLKPMSNIPDIEKSIFYAGQALAKQPWVKAPTVTFARDGLGPLYNARSCLGCHKKGGRGRINESTSDTSEHIVLMGPVLRVSVPGNDPFHGVVPESVYGDQLQTQSTALSHQLSGSINTNKLSRFTEPQPEASIHLQWLNKESVYPDGQTILLRYPKVTLKNLAYGPLQTNAMLSLRNAPPLLGLGLIELIAQQDIAALEDPVDFNRDHISGRLNWVWDVDKAQMVPGRFGLKANRPANLRTVTAAAFSADIGISNPLFPSQPCTKTQTLCLNAAHGNDQGGVELPLKLLDLVADYSRNLGVPKRSLKKIKRTVEGKLLFEQVGCQQCHTARFVTQESTRLPHLSKQIIFPYSDFLLHDMGPALADGRPDFNAMGAEWRTAPLWGVGLSNRVNGANNFLHDGRARTIEEAVLWHGGEAIQIKNKFMHLPKKKRLQLLGFVESL